MALALSLDLGTTSLGATAIDRHGRVRARVQRPNSAHRRNLPAGHAEQDPNLLLAAAVDALRSLSEQLDDEAVALGLTGQMHGVLIADTDNRPLTPLISWQDRRVTSLESFLARCPDNALRNAGCRPAPGYGGVTLHWLHERGELPGGAWRAVTIADWIGAQLAEAAPRMDASHAAALGLFDLVEGAWSNALLAAAHLTPDRLPEVVPSGAAIETLSAAMAQTTGLRKGIPVIAAIGDHQAAVLGSLPSDGESVHVNIGTGGQVSWLTPRFVRVDGMDTRPLPANRLMLTGAGVSGGDAYAWVERTVSAWLSAFGERRDPDQIYARLAELAGALPDDNGGLVSRPVFRGTRRRPDERGSFQGVSFDNFTPGHVARAVLEGVAAGLHDFLESAGEHAPRASRIIAAGNAVRRNPLLARALEARFGLPVWTPLHEEEAAYGAAMLAGVAAGMWSDIEDAGRTMQLRRALADATPASRG